MQLCLVWVAVPLQYCGRAASVGGFNRVVLLFSALCQDVVSTVPVVSSVSWQYCVGVVAAMRAALRPHYCSNAVSIVDSAVSAMRQHTGWLWGGIEHNVGVQCGCSIETALRQYSGQLCGSIVTASATVSGAVFGTVLQWQQYQPCLQGWQYHMHVANRNTNGATADAIATLLATGVARQACVATPATIGAVVGVLIKY